MGHQDGKKWTELNFGVPVGSDVVVYRQANTGSWLRAQVTNIPATGGMSASLFDPYTILAAVVDDTPVAVAVGSKKMVGRNTGSIKGMTSAEVLDILDPIDLGFY